MTAFQKPQALKAALKMALYGPAGSGKTFTSLHVSEGLAPPHRQRPRLSPSPARDTEYGTADSTAKGGSAQRRPPEGVRLRRAVHQVDSPKVLDASASSTRLLTGGVVLVIDSISHLLDACRNAYKCKLTKAGKIP